MIVVIDMGIVWDYVGFGGGYGFEYCVVGGWDFVENDVSLYDDGLVGFYGIYVVGILVGFE